MKHGLALGNTGNYKKMDSMMGGSFQNQKEKHKNQLAESMIKLYDVNKLLEERKATRREDIQKQCEEQSMA